MINTLFLPFLLILSVLYVGEEKFQTSGNTEKGDMNIEIKGGVSIYVEKIHTRLVNHHLSKYDNQSMFYHLSMCDLLAPTTNHCGTHWDRILPNL